MNETSDTVFFSAHREIERDGIRACFVGELTFLDPTGMRALVTAFGRRPWPAVSLVRASGSTRRTIALVPGLGRSPGGCGVRPTSLDPVAIPLTA
jgi:hypothetical protein